MTIAPSRRRRWRNYRVLLWQPTSPTRKSRPCSRDAAPPAAEKARPASAKYAEFWRAATALSSSTTRSPEWRWSWRQRPKRRGSSVVIAARAPPQAEWRQLHFRPLRLPRSETYWRGRKIRSPRSKTPERCRAARAWRDALPSRNAGSAESQALCARSAKQCIAIAAGEQARSGRRASRMIDQGTLGPGGVVCVRHWRVTRQSGRVRGPTRQPIRSRTRSPPPRASDRSRRAASSAISTRNCVTNRRGVTPYSLAKFREKFRGLIATRVASVSTDRSSRRFSRIQNGRSRKFSRSGRLKRQCGAELGLPTRSTHIEHQRASDPKGDLDAEVLLNHCERKVDAGCHTRRRRQLPIANIDRLGVHCHRGVFPCEPLTEKPMGRHPLAGEQAGLRQEERSRANRRVAPRLTVSRTRPGELVPGAPVRVGHRLPGKVSTGPV